MLRKKFKKKGKTNQENKFQKILFKKYISRKKDLEKKFKQKRFKKESLKEEKNCWCRSYRTAIFLLYVIKNSADGRRLLLQQKGPLGPKVILLDGQMDEQQV